MGVGRVPRYCLERHPTAQSVRFGGCCINLAAVAQRGQMDTGYISRIFSGKRRPSLNHAERLAETLGMGLESFLGALRDRIRLLETQPPKVRKHKKSPARSAA